MGYPARYTANFCAAASPAPTMAAKATANSGAIGGVLGDSPGGSTRRGIAFAHQTVALMLSVESARSTAPPLARIPATISSKFCISCGSAICAAVSAAAGSA